MTRSGVLKTKQFGSSGTYVLRPMAETAKAEGRTFSGICETVARRLHGREVAHAIGYKSTFEKVYKRFRNGTLSKGRSQKFRYRLEFSVRVAGAVLIRNGYTYGAFGVERLSGWRQVAKLEPLTGETVQLLVAAWDALGYMTTVHRSRWMEAEYAINLINDLMAD